MIKALIPAVALGVVLTAGLGLGGSKPAAADGLFQPDLQLSYQSSQTTTLAPGYAFTQYTFKVRNLGAADAIDVQATGQTEVGLGNAPYQVAAVQNATFLQAGSGSATVVALGTLQAGQTKVLTVFCATTPQHTCEGARVRVDGSGAEAGNHAVSQSANFW